MGRTSRKRRLKNQETFKKSPVDNEDLYEKLSSWMICNNWQASCNLLPNVFKTTGRGLMTLEEIKINQTVFKIPKSLLITTNTVSQSYIKFLFSSKNYSAQCVLAIFLIYEKHLGYFSVWKPYLDTLPSYYTNPEFCSKHEKLVLPLFILNEMEKISRKLKDSFMSVIESIKMLCNKTCNHCNQSFFKIFTYYEFSWAYYTVNTRAIYINNNINKNMGISIKGDDNLALAPLLDLFNHTCETVADAQLVTYSNNEKFYEITSLKTYCPKQQVFINYGAHSNLNLYLEYGFCIPKNPLDQIFFNLSDIQKCYQIGSSACSFIKIHGFDKNMAFTAEGLNYSAKNALFVITSNIGKESFWKKKMYHEEFNNVDWQLIINLALLILQKKKIEFILSLENMTSIVKRSESFCIAINFVKQYLEVIDKSFEYFKSFSLS